MINLNDGEKIEDLQYEGLRIIQSANEYRFTTDAVLLANFVKGAKGKTVVELGAGCGVISILIAKKQCPKKTIAVEIQPIMFDLLERNISLNQLQIQAINDDMREVKKYVSDADIVVCNPPYRAKNSGEGQIKESIRNCRHETLIDLSGVVFAACSALRYGGSFFLVHQAERFADVACAMRANGMELKEACLIRSFAGQTPKHALFKAVKGGKVGLKWLPDIVVFGENGRYTPTVKRLYALDDEE